MSGHAATVLHSLARADSLKVSTNRFKRRLLRLADNPQKCSSAVSLLRRSAAQLESFPRSRHPPLGCVARSELSLILSGCSQPVTCLTRPLGGRHKKV